MPDGKRSSIPTEGENDGVNCFYDEDLQNAGSPAKKLPVNLTNRGFHSLSERLLRTMVANELKKTLDAEDNKKLVAHHRPVLHLENDNSESEMVVVGVVLNAKQSQNDEVSKAIDMLRKNGVSCVYFTLKEAPTTNGTKKDENVFTENHSLPDDILKSVQDQQDDIPRSPEASESNSLTEKKVSSPTVSTTSDYATSPLECKKNEESENNEANDTCTSTTSPLLKTTAEDEIGPVEGVTITIVEKLRNSEASMHIGNETHEAESSTLSTSPPSPPTLVAVIEDEENLGDQGANSQPVVNVSQKPVSDTAALRRKKRRKRMYPYVSRRKSRNKRKKQSLPQMDDESSSDKICKLRKTENAPDGTIRSSKKTSPPVQFPEPQADVAYIPKKEKVDPYEFEESDVDNTPAAETLKFPIGKKSKRSTSGRPTTQNSNKSKPLPSTLQRQKKAYIKGSPRKKLTFSDGRAFSPDITDHENCTLRDAEVNQSEGFPNKKLSQTESCVQPISRDKIIDTTLAKTSTGVSLMSNVINDDTKLVLPNGQCPPSLNCDETIRADQVTTSTDASQRDKDGGREEQSIVVAQDSCKVQKKEKACKEELTDKDKEPVQLTSNDSIPDGPDSMQLRRSSFYSSISRNVRTNLEKYLDGRPQDLKAPRRSKKIKNGFLLHHGDNFPDNPEAPYRLHLATQVLLKLNKRRVKCKPKEEKGKSLLSYLKLQPKRVSRVGKHSKPAEDSEALASKEDTSVFSGEWTVERKFICNICGQVENCFWDMVMHKGEIHPGIVVTHVELSNNPPDGFRSPASPREATTLPNPPPCSKCATSFPTYSDLHRHIFECAGNAAVLEDNTAKVAKKKRSKRKRGFKRRISGVPKKTNNNNNVSNKPILSTPTKSGEITKRRYSEVFKCEFCEREFKTEGWLKNHVSLSHSLPVSIPLDKLSLPSRASFSSSRRLMSHLSKPSKQPC